MAEGNENEKGTGDTKKNLLEDTTSQESTTEWLISMMKKQLKLDEKPKPEKVLKQVDLDGIVEFIKSERCKHIITMAGAGISTSAGIPDFRSPGSGLYDNLQRYNLPNPQAIFEISFFRENPEPFFHLARQLWPGVFKPTPSHYFLELLRMKGKLLRHYTQNIDTLERIAGLTDDCVIEAHGTFHTSHCLNCSAVYSQDWMQEQIFKKNGEGDNIPTCSAEDCNGVVKPDIVFFGEQLPPKFFTCVSKDLPKCDLLIVMGTSLVVQPFASLTQRVPEKCPRLYINLENSSSGSDPLMAMLGMGNDFKFEDEDNYRDVFYQNTCDDGCYNLADKLGWGEELRNLVKERHADIDAASVKV